MIRELGKTESSTGNGPNLPVPARMGQVLSEWTRGGHKQVSLQQMIGREEMKRFNWSFMRHSQQSQAR